MTDLYLNPIMDNTTVNGHHFTEAQKSEFVERFSEGLNKFYQEQGIDPKTLNPLTDSDKLPDQQEILQIAQEATHGFNHVAQHDDNPDTETMSDQQFQVLAERLALPSYVSLPLEATLSELTEEGFTEGQVLEFADRYIGTWEELAKGTDAGDPYVGYLAPPTTLQLNEMLSDAMHGLNDVAQHDNDDSTTSLTDQEFKDLKHSLGEEVVEQLENLPRYYGNLTDQALTDITLEFPISDLNEDSVNTSNTTRAPGDAYDAARDDLQRTNQQIEDMKRLAGS